MKLKKLISIILSTVMLLSITAGLNFSAYATDYTNTETPVSANILTTGDTFQMGMYPQSEVTDEATVNALATIECTMTNYGYMQNTRIEDGEYKYDEVDMGYADIAYNGDLYRKVEINEYRRLDLLSWAMNYTYQADNGYEVGNTYYFKWEPIEWQVLAKEDDGVYVMSQSQLDAQAYHNYVEDITWEKSSLREWLNKDFYNAAFSENEQEKIATITNINENSPNDATISGGNNTADKVWVLSYSDAINTDYGFNEVSRASDEARRSKGSDYAKAQGLRGSTSSEYEYSYWWLRTPGAEACSPCCIKRSGFVNYYSFVNFTFGVRPALKINLNSNIFKSDYNCRLLGHAYESTWSKDADNHWHACSKCGEIKDKAAHTWNDGVITMPATETAEGIKTYTCIVCNAMKTEAIAKLQETPSQPAGDNNTTPQNPPQQPDEPQPPTIPATTAKKVKLSLKKVKVKKNAKKLVLQATLKINGKAVKGKKITFKFNGKKYTAKTNKKGVAKVTVKKSVLKKLKKGKKITYSAKYGKKTVKKTVKVK